jgi:hypothetical protein
VTSHSSIGDNVSRAPEAEADLVNMVETIRNAVTVGMASVLSAGLAAFFLA